jgi:voltage-gated potassium channel
VGERGLAECPTAAAGADRPYSLAPAMELRRSLGHRLRETDAYELLLAFIVLSIVFAEAAPERESARVASVAIQGITLMFALWTSRVSRRGLILALCAAIIGLVASVIAAAAGSDQLVRAFARLVNVMLILLATFAIARGLLRNVTERRFVTLQPVLGVVCIYLLLGMLFSYSYGAIAAIDSGDFFKQGFDGHGPDFVYFSFVTLTTVGYGDLTAADGLGRALAIVEALTGQLYLVTVVALFVSNLAPQRRRAAARDQS